MSARADTALIMVSYEEGLLDTEDLYHLGLLTFAQAAAAVTQAAANKATAPTPPPIVHATTVVPARHGGRRLFESRCGCGWSQPADTRLAAFGAARTHRREKEMTPC